MLLFEIVSSYSVCKVIVFFGFFKGSCEVIHTQTFAKVFVEHACKTARKTRDSGFSSRSSNSSASSISSNSSILELDDFYALLCAELQAQFLQLELLDLAASR